MKILERPIFGPACRGRCALSTSVWLFALIGIVAFQIEPTSADAVDPQTWFSKAVQIDLSGNDRDTTHFAFELYRRAADAGLPEAEFNIGIMLDSGRGVAADVRQAAIWYARAAAHGNKRAAYNLGQLYEAGQGVPQNSDLALTWFAASNLPAAKRRRVTSSRARGAFTPPVLVSPQEGAILAAKSGIELVWTARAQPEPSHFFVQLRNTDRADPKEVLAGFVSTSSTLIEQPEKTTEYAWRVLTVARDASHYAASPWSIFQVIGYKTGLIKP